MEEAIFAEKISGTELTHDCNSTAVNLSIPCNHSNLLNSTAVNSKLPPLYSKGKNIYLLASLYISRASFTITCLFGITGNPLVFYVVGYLKKKRNSEDVYVLVLASADLIISLTQAVYFIMIQTNISCDHNCWMYIYDICGSIGDAGVSASAWILVLISLNRYR